MTMTRFAGWGRRSRPFDTRREDIGGNHIQHRRRLAVGASDAPVARPWAAGASLQVSRPSRSPCAIAAVARPPAQAQEPTSRNELEGSSARIRRVSSAACS